MHVLTELASSPALKRIVAMIHPTDAYIKYPKPSQTCRGK